MAECCANCCANCRFCDYDSGEPVCTCQASLNYDQVVDPEDVCAEHEED